jgi:hypothetical protein
VLVTAGKLRQGLELERISTPVEAEFFLDIRFMELIEVMQVGGRYIIGYLLRSVPN